MENDCHNLNLFYFDDQIHFWHLLKPQVFELTC